MSVSLNFNDVPRNKNNAEHDIKTFATLRRAIDGTSAKKSFANIVVVLIKVILEVERPSRLALGAFPHGSISDRAT